MAAKEISLSQVFTAAAEAEWAGVKGCEDFDVYWKKLPAEQQFVTAFILGARISLGTLASMLVSMSQGVKERTGDPTKTMDPAKCAAWLARLEEDKGVDLPEDLRKIVQDIYAKILRNAR